MILLPDQQQGSSGQFGKIFHWPNALGNKLVNQANAAKKRLMHRRNRRIALELFADGPTLSGQIDLFTPSGTKIMKPRKTWKLTRTTQESEE